MVKKVRKFLKLAGCLLLILYSPSSYAKQTYELRVHHFFPPGSIEHVDFFIPWAEALESDSNGRIKMRVFPAMMLGGSPRQLLDQVKNGIADIVFGVPSYNPGYMPRIEVFELPFVHGYNMLATSMAFQSMSDDGWFAEDFGDEILPLFLYVHRGNSFHCKEGTRIEKVEDLRGKRIRTPSRIGSALLEALGAVAVSMPLPQVRQALVGGIVECALLPFTGLKSGSLEKGVIKHQTFVTRDGERTSLSTLALGIFMSKAVYESMPPDLQKLILKYTGIGLVPHWSKFYTKDSEMVMRDQVKNGSESIIMSDEESQKVEAILGKMMDQWIEEATENGVDNAEEIFQEAIFRIEKFERDFPLSNPDEYMDVRTPFPAKKR